MNKYLITGVTGFVGRYLVEYINQTEPSSQIFGIGTRKNCALPIHYCQINLKEKEQTENLLADIRPDYIIHLASMSSVGESWKNPDICFQNNTGIMLNILTATANLKLKTRLLSVGSSEEYGNYPADKMPLKECYELMPQNPYAVAKVSQEMLCKLFINYGLDIVMTRSFNHIGPYQDTRFVVPSFIKQLVEISQNKKSDMTVGNINISRDFTDVRDVVNAYYKILHQGKTGEVYNVCSGKKTKLKDIITLTESCLGIKAAITVDSSLLRKNDSKIIFGDNSKLKNELSWSPQYSIKDTIKDIIQSYIEQ